MAQASMIEVAGWAYDAGLRNPVKLAQAVAIATAESGRNPDRLGDITLQNATWGPSVGLWQVRSLKADTGTGRIRDRNRLTDPAFNARAMVEISKSGSDWSPWTVTHPSNLMGFSVYTATLPLAQPAVAAMLAQKGGQIAGGAVQDAAGQVLEPVTQLAGVVSDAVRTPARILAWLTTPGAWARIVYVGMGAALVVLGVALIAKPVLAPVVKTASKAAGVVATKGKGV